MARFYGYFAAAYGTMWLAMFFVALITWSHIDAGAFGFIGFPLLALGYAVVRITLGPASEMRVLTKQVASLEARFVRANIGAPEGCETPAYACPTCNMISTATTAEGACPHCGTKL